MKPIVILMATLALALAAPAALAKSGNAANPQASSPGAPPGQARTDASTPPGQAKQGNTMAPGQAKKEDGPGPPGQVKKEDGPLPPGQARQDDKPLPPGQVKKLEPTDPPASDPDEALRLVEMNAALPLARIVALAEARSTGHVIDARLVRLRTTLLYQLTLLDAEGQSWREYYDAMTGDPVALR